MISSRALATIAMAILLASDGMLAANGPWDCGIHVEASTRGELPFANDRGRRGWLHPERAVAGNMPHNWTSAELVAALRDVFVREVDGRLVLGSGVPRSWLTPGAVFGVDAMPTTFGPVSYRATVRADGSVALAVSGGVEAVLDLPMDS